MQGGLKTPVLTLDLERLTRDDADREKRLRPLLDDEENRDKGHAHAGQSRRTRTTESTSQPTSGAGVLVKDREWGRRAFSVERRRAVAALLEAMLSSETDEGILVPAPSSLTERVANEFGLMVGAGSSDLRRGFWLLTMVLEWLPLFILGEFSRASRLPIARRLAYLHGLEHAKSPVIAAIFMAFKLPITLLAFELGDELALTGFDRPTIASPRRVTKLHVIEGELDDELAEAAEQVVR